MHPAFDGLAALPFYDEFDLSTVDVLLISQYVLSLPQNQRQGLGGHIALLDAYRSPSSQTCLLYLFAPAQFLHCFPSHNLLYMRINRNYYLLHVLAQPW